MNTRRMLVALVVFCVAAAAAWTRGRSQVGPRRLVVEVLESANSTFSPVDRKLFQLFLANYRFQLLGEAVINGRVAWVVVAKPKFRKQPCRQFWIDSKQRVVLAFKDWGCGSVLKRVEVLPYSRQQISGKGSPLRGSTSLGGDRVLCGFDYSATPFYRLACLPKGFRYIGRRVIGSGWHQDIYSDGAYAVSVFTRFLRSGRWENRNSGLVYLAGVGFIFTGRQGTVEYVVVGDLPLPELRVIQESIGKNF
ncbi:MAG: hypothetical protein QHI38_10305 [Armatimonadota bacterium]|nr:hypothetical protein [Armatimonadota bacterium]